MKLARRSIISDHSEGEIEDERDDERKRAGTKADRELASWGKAVTKVVEDAVKSAMSRMEQKLDAAITREERCYAILQPRVLRVEKAQQEASTREDFRVLRYVSWSVISSVAMVLVLMWYIFEHKLFRFFV